MSLQCGRRRCILLPCGNISVWLWVRMCGCAFMTTTTRRVPVGAGVLYDAASPTGTLSLHEAQRSMTQDSTEKREEKLAAYACMSIRQIFLPSQQLGPKLVPTSILPSSMHASKALS